MLKKGLFILFFIASISVFSQNIIEGQVLDYQTKEPLTAVSVLIEHQTNASQTDENGQFSLNLPQGTYILSFEKQGFFSKKMIVELSELKITLPPILLEINQLQNEAFLLLSEEELADNENFTQTAVGFLQRSNDIFLKRSAYDFSAVYFTPRGYQANNATILLNGLPMNRIENGSALWANWAGLNDVTQNQEVSFGLNFSDEVFGGVLGSTNIVINPAQSRKRFKISASAANKTYTGRLMASFHSGKLKNGISYSLSASRRFSPTKTYIDGTLLNAYSVFGAISSQLTDNQSLTLFGLYAFSRRGKTAALTSEVIDLQGFRYNPLWGWQNGDVRNSRNKTISEPIFGLSYRFETEKTQLQAGVGYQTGSIKNTHLTFANAQNPEPTYYQNLPSFYINQSAGADYFFANLQKEYFLENPQLNWERLYWVNQSAKSHRSAYFISADVNAERSFLANLNFQTAFSEFFKWNFGAIFKRIFSENYAQIDDLLGGNYAENYDFLTQHRYDENGILQKNEGEKWQYHYDLKSNVAEIFTQGYFRFKKIDFFVGLKGIYTDYQRDGKFKNPLFEDSFGKHNSLIFNGLSFKSGILYQLNPRHFFQWNVGYFTQPPSVKNAFLNIENSNKITSFSTEKIFTSDVNYWLRLSKLKTRLTAYFTHFSDATQSNSFFTETYLTNNSNADFVWQTLQNIEKRHFGVEFGAEIPLSSSLKLETALGLGQFVYANNPKMSISSNQVQVIENQEVSLKNYRVASAPERVFSVAAEYRKSLFWASVSASFLSHNFVLVSPITRTKNFFINPATGSFFENIDHQTARKLLAQERLNDVFLVNFVAGKSWRFNKNFVSLFLNISNLFDRKFMASGFEQSRLANYERMLRDNANGQPSFGNKYSVGQGRAFLANFSISF